MAEEKTVRDHINELDHMISAKPVKEKPPKNGQLDPAIPEHRQKIIEYGIAATQQTAAELDAARKSIDDLTKQNAALRVEIQALQGLSAAMESRSLAHQSSRDEAITARAEYEVLLRSIQAQLREFNIKHEPVVNVADDN